MNERQECEYRKKWRNLQPLFVGLLQRFQHKIKQSRCNVFFVAEKREGWQKRVYPYSLCLCHHRFYNGLAFPVCNRVGWLHVRNPLVGKITGSAGRSGLRLPGHSFGGCLPAWPVFVFLEIRKAGFATHRAAKDNRRFVESIINNLAHGNRKDQFYRLNDQT